MLAGAIAWPATPVPQRCALQPEHAAILVMQNPAVVKAKAAGGCPAADYQEKAPGLAAFQVRNLCAKSGDGLLGNYLVDLNTGEVREDGPSARRLDSADLRSTRLRVCAMSVKGVVPSLLPHGHTSRARVRRMGTASGRTPAAATASAARKKASVTR